MEHHLLAPLHALLLKERPQSEEELSAANLVGMRLLQGPYLAPTYKDWGLFADRSGRWVLSQPYNDEVITRDVLEPFHESPYYYEGDEEGSPPLGLYEVPAIQKAFYDKPIVQDEGQVPQRVRDLADAMMGRLQHHFPSAVALLMAPTPEQVSDRYEVAVKKLEGDNLGEHLRPIIGSLGDWSLKAYGIKYHSPASIYNNDVYFVAHNRNEICGIMCLGGSRGWGYGVRYISVSPGFQHRGISKRLYQAALDLCAKEKKVLVRTPPGNGTPPLATLAYDRMVKASAVLHTTTDSPLYHALERAAKNGWGYDDLEEMMKPVCDEAILPRAARMEGRTCLTHQEMDKLLEAHASTIDRLFKSPPPARRRGPRP